MKYYGGCDVGSTYTKAVILDETGKMVANTTIRSKINSEQSAIMAMDEVVSQVPELHSSKDLAYLIGTGYGRNKVPFADENISEISCHAMGVHVTDPNVRAIIDIGGQEVVSRIFRKLVCRLCCIEVSQQWRRPQWQPPGASYSCTSCCPTGCRPHGAAGHRPA